MNRILRWTAPSPRHALGALGLASALALGVAWVAQYGFGLRPCELCMAQRYPYMAVVILCTAGALFARARKTSRIVLLLVSLILLGEAGLAAYHAGVEKGLFDGPTACTGAGEPGMSLEDLRAQILSSEVVACNAPAIEVMGITMAGANAAYALALSAIGFGLWRRRHPEGETP